MPSTSRSNPKTNQLLNHQFEDESGQEYNHTEFGDFRTYMLAKQTKLQNQAIFDANEGDGEKSEIFKGCVVYIDGFTGSDYSSEQLKILIIKNGGVHINNLWGGKTVTTHVVANNLTTRKKELWKNCTIVKPEWIVESVKAGKRLSWRYFKTIDVEDRQSTLKVPVLKSKENTEQLDSKVSRTEDVNSTNGVPKITDPNFITHFYENSRLHHLSKWKAMLREKYLQNQNLTFPSHTDNPVLMHIDYDSFFVSATLLKYPELVTKPCCVASGNDDSSDIASANYVARAKGVRNGMWLGKARELCPDINILKFDFAAYEKASDDLYAVIQSYSPRLLYPVSVDEAIIDVTNVIDKILAENEAIDSIKDAVEHLASRIRNKIRSRSGLEASVGAGSNMLLTRIALSKAKPKGHQYISYQDRLSVLDDGSVSLRDIPGVGRSVVNRLNALRITSFSGLRNFPLSKLIAEFGQKTAVRLHEVSNGDDSVSLLDSIRQSQSRKSAGVEISWGVRATSLEEVHIFLRHIVNEVMKRMSGYLCGSVTVKVYRATDDNSKWSKRMGHGKCDIFSKSKMVKLTNDSDLIYETVIGLAECEPERLRGVGVSCGKLMRKEEVENGGLMKFIKKKDKESVEPLTNELASGQQLTKQVTLSKQDSSETGENPRGVDDSHDKRFDEVETVLRQDSNQQVNIPEFSCTPIRPDTIDWEIYNALPSTLKSAITEEYHLEVDPQEPHNNNTTVTNGFSKRSAPPLNRPAKKTKLLKNGKQNTLTQQRQAKESTEALSFADLYYHQASSLIDPGVFDSLPNDIQKELRAVMSNTVSDNLKKANSNTLKASESTHTCDISQQEMPRKKQMPVPGLDTKFTDPVQVRGALKKWISFSKDVGGGPHHIDVEVVEKYLLQLTENENGWDKCVKLIEMMDREIKKMGNDQDEWENVIATIKKKVDEKMNEMGIKLMYW